MNKLKSIEDIFATQKDPNRALQDVILIESDEVGFSTKKSETIRALLKAGADPCYKLISTSFFSSAMHHCNHEQMAILFSSVKENNMKIVTLSVSFIMQSHRILLKIVNCEFSGKSRDDFNSLKTKTIQTLLTAGADVNFMEDKETVLTQAQRSCNYEQLTLLINSAKKIEDAQVLLRTVIMRGVRDNLQHNIVRLLLEKGAKVDFITLPPIIIASTENSLMVPLLLECGASAKTVDAKGNQSFFNIVKRVCSRKEESLEEDRIPFSEKVPVLNALLKAGADCNHSGQTGDTALHVAVLEKKNIDVVKYLLESNADATLENKNNQTPLMLAAMKGNKPALELMLARTENLPTTTKDDLCKEFLKSEPAVSYEDAPNVTWLLANCERIDSPIIKVLYRQLLIKKAKDSLENTMLHEAFKQQNMKNISNLMKSGFDIFAFNKDNKAPLSFSNFSKDDTSLISLLCTHMVDINGKDQNGNTIAHYIARLRNFTEPFDYMKKHKPEIDFSILNNDGNDALYIAAENRHYEVVAWLKANCDLKPKNKVIQKHVAFKNACFRQSNSSFMRTGWISSDDKSGALVLTDNVQDEQCIVHFPDQKKFGILHNEKEKCELFYGTPELGTNLVWKPIDTDPAIYLNVFHRTSNFIKSSQLLTRVKQDGKYHVETLEFSLDILKTFGSEVVKEAYKDTEVLSLRNLCGEGTSLTHEEWDILHPVLAYFSEEFASFLLDSEVPQELAAARNNLRDSSKFVSDIKTLTKWVIDIHPPHGSSRLVNKLLSLLCNLDNEIHKEMKPKIDSLYDKVLNEEGKIYEEYTQDIILDDLKERCEAVKQSMANNQATESGVPSWFNDETNAQVPAKIVLQLLVKMESLPLYWASSTLPKNYNPENQFMKHIYTTTLSPTYEDLLAQGYIKVAHALRPVLEEELNNLFKAPTEIKMAPIKELRRCRDKIIEASKSATNKPPYAATLCDYLRASVLCGSMKEMEEALYALSNKFEIVRVKPRIRKHPNDKGNKCLLVNLIVKSSNVKHLEYKWSDWWNNKPVSMIAEVQITIQKLFYVAKQAHNAYDMVRTTTCLEWKHFQGYSGWEKELFPTSPLYHDPLCLL